MRTFTQTYTDYTTLCNDASANNVTLGKALINRCCHNILAMSDWNFNKASKTYASVANQQDYDPPYNMEKMEYVNVTYGGITYTPDEIKSGKDWTILNRIVVNSDVPQYWYFSNRTNKIGIFPIPSSNGNVIKAGFTKKIKDMGSADYVIGTITTTANSTTITGAGTAWTADMVGRYIQIVGATVSNTPMDGYWFEIVTVTNATTLVVKQSPPNSGTLLNYQISELIPLPDGFEDIPLYFALAEYYGKREKDPRSMKYQTLYQNRIDEMFKRDSRTVNDIMEKQVKPIGVQDVNRYPMNLS